MEERGIPTNMRHSPTEQTSSSRPSPAPLSPPSHYSSSLPPSNAHPYNSNRSSHQPHSRNNIINNNNNNNSDSTNNYNSHFLQQNSPQFPFLSLFSSLEEEQQLPPVFSPLSSPPSSSIFLRQQQQHNRNTHSNTHGDSRISVQENELLNHTVEENNSRRRESRYSSGRYSSSSSSNNIFNRPNQNNSYRYNNNRDHGNHFPLTPQVSNHNDIPSSSFQHSSNIYPHASQERLPSISPYFPPHLAISTDNHNNYSNRSNASTSTSMSGINSTSTSVSGINETLTREATSLMLPSLSADTTNTTTTTPLHSPIHSNSTNHHFLYPQGYSHRQINLPSISLAVTTSPLLLSSSSSSSSLPTMSPSSSPSPSSSSSFSLPPLPSLSSISSSSLAMRNVSNQKKKQGMGKHQNHEQDELREEKNTEIRKEMFRVNLFAHGYFPYFVDPLPVQITQSLLDQYFSPKGEAYLLDHNTRQRFLIMNIHKVTKNYFFTYGVELRIRVKHLSIQNSTGTDKTQLIVMYQDLKGKYWSIYPYFRSGLVSMQQFKTVHPNEEIILMIPTEKLPNTDPNVGKHITQEKRVVRVFIIMTIVDKIHDFVTQMTQKMESISKGYGTTDGGKVILFHYKFNVFYNGEDTTLLNQHQNDISNSSISGDGNSSNSGSSSGSSSGGGSGGNGVVSSSSSSSDVRSSDGVVSSGTSGGVGIGGSVGIGGGVGSSGFRTCDDDFDDDDDHGYDDNDDDDDDDDIVDDNDINILRSGSNSTNEDGNIQDFLS